MIRDGLGSILLYIVSTGTEDCMANCRLRFFSPSNKSASELIISDQTYIVVKRSKTIFTVLIACNICYTQVRQYNII